MIRIHRPMKQSLQKWGDQVGDQNYTWENFLPFYKESCKYTAYDTALYINATDKEDPSVFDPAGGPLHISFGKFVDSFVTWPQKGFPYGGINVTDGLSSNFIRSAYATLTIDPINALRSSSEASIFTGGIAGWDCSSHMQEQSCSKLLFNGTTATGPYCIQAIDIHRKLERR